MVHRHGRAVAPPWTKVKNAGVPTRAVAESGRQLINQLMGNANIVQVRNDLTPAMKIAPIGVITSQR